MGVLEEVLKNKEEFLVKFLSIVEGRETSAKISLDGVQFKIGKTTVKMDGQVVLTVVPFSKGKKK